MWDGTLLCFCFSFHTSYHIGPLSGALTVGRSVLLSLFVASLLLSFACILRNLIHFVLLAAIWLAAQRLIWSHLLHFFVGWSVASFAHIILNFLHYPISYTSLHHMREGLLLRASFLANVNQFSLSR